MGEMNDRPPRWGEPGSAPPDRSRVKLRRGQRRALWLALGLAAVGQVAYEVAVNQHGTVTGGTATANGSCCTGPFYDRPGVAAAGFVVSAVAVALAVSTAARATSPAGASLVDVRAGRDNPRRAEPGLGSHHAAGLCLLL